MYRYTSTKGYSLVESLVAIAILMLSIVGPITIAAKSLQSAQYARQQNTAFFLAQEGISIINTLRNDGGLAAYLNPAVDGWEAWTGDANLAPCFETTGCNFDVSDSTLNNNVVDCNVIANCLMSFSKSATRSVYNLSSGEDTPYTRVIQLRFVTSAEVQVNSTVTWNSQILGGEQEITLTTSLFNLYE